MGLLGKLFGKKPRDEASTPAPSANDAPDASEGADDQNGPDIAPELAPALKAFQAGRHDVARRALARCLARSRAAVKLPQAPYASL